MIDIYIEKLISYGKSKGFFEETDRRYIRNRILEILKYNDYKEPSEKAEPDENIEEILDFILRWSAEMGIIKENTPLYRDLLDAALMGAMLPRPSEVIKEFYARFEGTPASATDYLYNLSINSNYIRKSRTDKNVKWKYQSEYGPMEITINVSKPEKDVREIEAERNTPKAGYPRCLLCADNEGYAGRLNHPARQNLRMIPLELRGERWFLQYSPYLYYNEHCILLNEKHIPMKIEEAALEKMMDFLDRFPHYFVGSNADLPIVGGSILSHDHFQGGRHRFAMEDAEELRLFAIPQYNEVKASILKWPLSVIRLASKDKEKLIKLGGQVIEHWREYVDEGAEIIPYTGDEPHNTVTPIARFKNGSYELDLVLRNNRSNEIHPLGIFHPHEEVHNIKKENIGLIEVMGLAVLPPRLLQESKLIERYLLNKTVSDKDKETLEKHMNLCKEISAKKATINEQNVEEIVKESIAQKFVLALRHAGVFKEDEEGQRSFCLFLKSLEWLEN